MSSDKKYKKGTQVYDAVYWLLKHYYEIKFYNVVGKNEVVKDIIESEESSSYSISDVIIFAEKEESCIRRLNEVVEYTESEYCTDLIRIMDRAYKLLVEKGGHCIIYSEIIRKRFMAKNVDCCQLEGMYSGYYLQLVQSIENYCEMFARVIKRNRGTFWDVHTNEDIVREVNMMQMACRVHEKKGICYRDTLKLLKNYKEIKFLGIQKRIGDTSIAIGDSLHSDSDTKNGFNKALDKIEYVGMPSNMKRWMYSSMVDTTNAYISFMEDALRRMGWLGNNGRDNHRMLEILFTDPEWTNRPKEDRMEEMGLSERQYYAKRSNAIEMFSKILWGPFGHRHCDSVFYKM